MLAAFAVSMTACSQWDLPYVGFDETGYTVSVRYELNGGTYAGADGVSVVDVFELDSLKTDGDGKKILSLLDPGDVEKRGEDNAKEISRSGYFLAGWYTQRELRYGDDGEALDEYGVPVSESGREQGYTYSGKWDFSKDTFAIDTSKEYSSAENVLTLYAAWIPTFTYEFYIQNSETEEFELIKDSTVKQRVINVPVWKESDGRLDMKDFPTIDGMTFDSAYLNPDMTEAVTETLSGNVDYETGTTTTETVKVYTKWIDGVWYKIYNANQLLSNARLDGNYIICADLDFSKQAGWSNTLAAGTFTGTIIGDGEGHKISNIKIDQTLTGTANENRGLFGKLGETAVIQNITFENITFNIGAGSRKQGDSFGLLAGSISEEATLGNVTVGGRINIGKDVIATDGYMIGLLFGTGAYEGIDMSNISCVPAEGAEDRITVDIDRESGEVTLTFAN